MYLKSRRRADEWNRKIIKEILAISELKNTAEGIKSRLDEAECQISKLEGKVEKTSQKEQEKEKKT